MSTTAETGQIDEDQNAPAETTETDAETAADQPGSLLIEVEHTHTTDSNGTGCADLMD